MEIMIFLLGALLVGYDRDYNNTGDGYDYGCGYGNVYGHGYTAGHDYGCTDGNGSGHGNGYGHSYSNGDGYGFGYHQRL
jgi:hypothetical protein